MIDLGNDAIPCARRAFRSVGAAAYPRAGTWRPRTRRRHAAKLEELFGKFDERVQAAVYAVRDLIVETVKGAVGTPRKTGELVGQIVYMVTENVLLAVATAGVGAVPSNVTKFTTSLKA
jgi:hypothetical protein